MSEDWYSPIYYRIVAHRDALGRITEFHVVTMQWFDEFDYDESQFITDEKFETKELAWLFVIEYITAPTRALAVAIAQLMLFRLR